MGAKIHLENIEKYVKNQLIFEHFSFEFEEGKDICIIGSESVGKTSLFKIILGLSSYQGSLKKEATCAGLICPVVNKKESIYEFLEYESLSLEDRKLVKAFLNFSSYDYLIQKLSLPCQIKVSILKELLKHPTFLFLDDVLYVFSKSEKRALFEFFHRCNITIIYVTSNMEDALFFPYLLIMGRHGILIEGNTIQVLKEEKILKRLGFSLPFLIDLSLQLSCYDLLQDVYSDERELTNQIWK